MVDNGVDHFFHGKIMVKNNSGQFRGNQQYAALMIKIDCYEPSGVVVQVVNSWIASTNGHGSLRAKPAVIRILQSDSP